MGRPKGGCGGFCLAAAFTWQASRMSSESVFKTGTSLVLDSDRLCWVKIFLRCSLTLACGCPTRERNFRADRVAQGRRQRAAVESGRGSWGRERGPRQWLLGHLLPWGWFPQDPSKGQLSLLSLSLLN